MSQADIVEVYSKRHLQAADNSIQQNSPHNLAIFPHLESYVGAQSTALACRVNKASRLVRPLVRLKAGWKACEMAAMKVEQWAV